MRIDKAFPFCFFLALRQEFKILRTRIPTLWTNSYCVITVGGAPLSSLKKLKRRQRSLSRKKKSSSRRNKARILVAKAHEKASNQRKDFLHKTANSYIQRQIGMGREFRKRHELIMHAWGAKTPIVSSEGTENED